MDNAIHAFYSKEQTQYLTHAFHPYPHKMVPQVARALIEQYSKGDDLIVDLFCGSGTVLVEANVLGRRAVGIDNNPLACLIAKVKTTPIDSNALKSALALVLDRCIEQLKKRNNLTDFIGKINPPVPAYPKLIFWFSNIAIRELALLKYLIQRIENKNIKDFMLVALSSIIKDSSHASSLYRLTRKKKIKESELLEVYRRFKEKANEMISVMDEFNVLTKSSSQVYQKDVRYLHEHKKNLHFFTDHIGYANDTLSLKKVDCIITYFPHAGLDFSRYFTIYFWWLDYGQSKQIESGLIRLPKSHVLRKFIAQSNTLNLNKNKSNQNFLCQYTSDLKLVFMNLHRLLKNDGYCCIMVPHGLERFLLGVPEYIINLGSHAGFMLEDRINRIVPKKAYLFAKEDKIETILIFKKKSK